ncbi:MAG: hypothetical protein ACRDH2_10315 [Anaerolineales bacterium]
MSHWISLYWAWLLPTLAALPALVRLREARAAYARGLVTARGWRWLLLALAAAQLLIGLTQLAVVYQTSLWLSVGGLPALGVMALALRAARAKVHPGLYGFQRPLPRDGLELIERERQLSRLRRTPLRWRLRPWLSLLPAYSLLLYLALYHRERWPDFSLLALVATAPLLLIPFRRGWLAPALLSLPVIILIGQGVSLRASLPPGGWATPVTGARCTGQVRVVRDARAWCANAWDRTIYQFDLQTGVLGLEARLPEAARVFAANARNGWIQQIPARGLIRVSAGAAETVRVLSAQAGAADAEDRLWVIDVGQELWLYRAERRAPVRSEDGLLNNTASVVKVSPSGDVWVGSISGASWLRAGTEQWQTLDQEAGLPGAVINFAFAPDGAVWLLWRARPGYGASSDWGVSQLAQDGALHHLELGPQTGLEAPRSEDALAVDGLGRVWFVTQSIPRREKFLGLATPQGDAPAELYSLGQFATTGPYAYGGTGLWQNSFGVVADGEGGILLYNGDAQPWRHWRPGWVDR